MKEVDEFREWARSMSERARKREAELAFKESEELFAATGSSLTPWPSLNCPHGILPPFRGKPH